MRSYRAQAHAVANYLEASDMTTAECPDTGVGAVSDLLEVLVAKYAKRRDAVGTVCESARQRVLWLRQPIPEGFHAQTAAARDFDEAYPLAGVYNTKWTPHLLRVLAGEDA